MPVEPRSTTSSLLDVLDRVLDKGIVIDARVRVSLIGLELVTVDLTVVVASIATYLDYSGALAELKTTAAQAAITRVGREHETPARGLPGRLP